MKLNFITIKIVTEREDAEEHLRKAISIEGFDISEYKQEVE